MPNLTQLLLLVSAVVLLALADDQLDTDAMVRYLEKRGGGRGFSLLEEEKRGGGRGFQGFRMETRGGARAFKRGGGRGFMERETRGGARVFQLADGADGIHTVELRDGNSQYFNGLEVDTSRQNASLFLDANERTKGRRPSVSWSVKCSIVYRFIRGGARSFPNQLSDSNEN
ncbi:unnamed protein product, partial [Mesorhabditis spiculigera]